MSDLAKHIEVVARHFLGDPNKALSSRDELRFGTRGSMAVMVNGEKRGVWHDHETGEGGGVLSLIRRHTGRANGAAVEYLRTEIGIDLPENARQPVAAFDYTDEHGELLFQVVRFEPKDFRQRRPDGAGGWSWKLGDVRRVLYRLPDVLDAGDRTIWLVEGEKDADRLARLGLVATCNPGGAGKWRLEYAASLRGANVVILPDNDEAGEQHAATVAKSLRGTAASVKVVRLPGLPDKGDVCDWLAAGGTVEELDRLAAEQGREAAQLEHPAPAAPEIRRASTFFHASEFAGCTVPEREWLVPDLIPRGTVTLLGGDGGTGKSLITLQLAAAVALGTPWLGRDVREGGALMLSAEDDRDELHRRLDAICAAEAIGMADLSRLTLRSVAGEDALLATFDQRGTLKDTGLFAELDQRIGDERPQVVALDTLSDLHAGNENDRAQARQFVGLLRGLAIRHHTAVVLLAHPSLSGLNSGSGTSGSTGWNNSVRSRLYLERVVQEGYEPDPDARVLRTMKANYGAVGGEIRMKWTRGVFVADAEETGLDRTARNMKGERVFLKILRQFGDQGRRVNHAGGQTYAPKVFAEQPGAEGVSTRSFRQAMEKLLADGKIRINEDGPPSKRRQFLEVAE